MKLNLALATIAALAITNGIVSAQGDPDMTIEVLNDEVQELEAKENMILDAIDSIADEIHSNKSPSEDDDIPDSGGVAHMPNPVSLKAVDKIKQLEKKKDKHVSMNEKPSDIMKAKTDKSTHGKSAKRGKKGTHPPVDQYQPLRKRSKKSKGSKGGGGWGDDCVCVEWGGKSGKSKVSKGWKDNHKCKKWKCNNDEHDDDWYWGGPTKEPTWRSWKKPSYSPSHSPTAPPSSSPPRTPSQSPLKSPSQSPSLGPSSSPSRSPIIDKVKDAFNSDNGLMVSMAFDGPVTDIDTSGSIMRKDLPQGLFGDPDVGNHRGVLFSDPPATNCSYTVDAETSNRLSHCGQYPVSSSPRDIDTSIGGECLAGQTAQEYAEGFYFQPRNSIGNWKLGIGTCHQKDPQETLAAQKALFFKIATDETGEELWNDKKITPKFGAPSAYNEFVFESIPNIADITAYVWAHEGSFYDITECPKNGQCELCKIRKELCPELTSPLPEKPLVEIANQNIAGKDGKLTYENITSYKEQVDQGGYNADEIFRTLSWEDVCGTTFFDNCAVNNQ